MAADLMERRKDPRAEHEEDTRFKIVGEEQSIIGVGFEKALTVNVSKSGVCIQLGHTIKEGNVIRVEIPVTLGEIKKQVKAFCEVQWCRPSKGEKSAFEAGLSFIAVKEEDVEILQSYVASPNNRAC